MLGGYLDAQQYKLGLTWLEKTWYDREGLGVSAYSDCINEMHQSGLKINHLHQRYTSRLDRHQERASHP